MRNFKTERKNDDTSKEKKKWNVFYLHNIVQCACSTSITEMMRAFVKISSLLLVLRAYIIRQIIDCKMWSSVLLFCWSIVNKSAIFPVHIIWMKGHWKRGERKELITAEYVVYAICSTVCAHSSHFVLQPKMICSFDCIQQYFCWLLRLLLLEPSEKWCFAGNRRMNLFCFFRLTNKQ